MNIKPSGLSQGAEVDLFYQITSSIAGICAKLDADGGVADTDYAANCSALITGYIEDQKANTAGSVGDWFISPRGINDKARCEFLYQFFDAFETMCEQLDADGTVNDTDYEANCYEALFLWMVENQVGSVLGNGNTFWFRPGGETPKKQLIDLYAAIVNAIETLTEQLDADSAVSGTNFEALWFTANIVMTVTDSMGNTYGN